MIYPIFEIQNTHINCVDNRNVFGPSPGQARIKTKTIFPLSQQKH